MYYILVGLFFIVIYFALVKVLSSVFKGCLVTVGLAALIAVIYILYISTKAPVNLYDLVIIDNLEVIFLGTL